MLTDIEFFSPIDGAKDNVSEGFVSEKTKTSLVNRWENEPHKFQLYYKTCHEQKKKLVYQLKRTNNNNPMRTKEASDIKRNIEAWKNIK